MSPEERELLNRSIKISEENNRMLRGMRRSARFSSFLRVIYWLIIIVTAFGTYYFIQPIIAPFINSYVVMQQDIQNIKSATTKLPALPSWLGGSTSTTTKK